MTIIVNGQPKELLPAETLQTLVGRLANAPEHVIAEVNGTIIDRKAWPVTLLKDGDKAELVTFVGGG